MEPRLFIAEIKAAAEACHVQTQLPLPSLLAIPALETGWGENLVHDGIHSHNLFNIKGMGTAGTVCVDTTEWFPLYEWRRLEKAGVRYVLSGRTTLGMYEGFLQQQFRRYSTYQESYDDFARVLRSLPRYALVRNALDPYVFCTRLAEAGFATDPHYTEKLHNILRNRVIPIMIEDGIPY